MGGQSEKLSGGESKKSLFKMLDDLREKATKEFRTRMQQVHDRGLDGLLLAAIAAIVGFIFGGPAGAAAMAFGVLAVGSQQGWFDPRPQVMVADPQTTANMAKHDVSQQMKVIDHALKKTITQDRQNALNIKRYVRSVATGQPGAAAAFSNLPENLRKVVRELDDEGREEILHMTTRELAKRLEAGQLFSGDSSSDLGGTLLLSPSVSAETGFPFPR